MNTTHSFPLAPLSVVIRPRRDFHDRTTWNRILAALLGPAAVAGWLWAAAVAFSRSIHGLPDAGLPLTAMLFSTVAVAALLHSVRLHGAAVAVWLGLPSAMVFATGAFVVLHAVM